MAGKVTSGGPSDAYAPDNRVVDRVPGVGAGGVFLSYHRPDWDMVRTLASELRARNIATFIDRENLVAGLPWPEALEQAIRTAAAVLVFLGSKDLSVWQKREVGFALERQVNEERVGRSFPVVPVLLPGSDPTSGFLFLNSWLDLRRTPWDPAVLDALVRAVGGERPPLTDLREEVCPYRGLRVFREEDAGFFFGRDAFVDQLFDTVLRHSLTVVVGPSGSGKSSVVQAGLLPRLRRRRPPGTSWDTAVCRPGGQPFQGVAESMISFLEPDLGPAAQLAEAQKLGNDLSTGAVRLDAVARRVLEESHGTDGVVLIVDQFEEVFTLASEPTPRTFVAALLAALAEGSLRVVLGLRADFYGRAIGLSRELSDRLSNAVVNLGPMRRQELEEAIVMPARRVGLDVEPDLVNIVLDDVDRAPGGLPLLEHALLELWERRSNRLLTVEAYLASGGVEGSIAQRAERYYLQLGPAEQDIIRRVMLRLTQPGQGTEDTRRHVVFEELVTRQSERESVERVVQTFTGARLLTTTGEQDSLDRWVDVAHEALIGGWPRLRQWIEDDRTGLHLAHRLATSAQEWLQLGKEEAALYRGARLAEALAWRDRNAAAVNELERTFLDASRELQQRETTRQQLAQFPLQHSAIWTGLLVLVVSTIVPIAIDLPPNIVSPLRVATMLVSNIGALVGVQYWLARSLVFSGGQTYLTVYRRLDLLTLVAAVLTLWYVSSTQWLDMTMGELNLAYVPPDAFVQYIVLLLLMTLLFAVLSFTLTWQVGP